MNLDLGNTTAATGSPQPMRSPKSRPARSPQVPLQGSPPMSGKPNSRRKSLAQQIDSAEKPAATLLPSMGVTSPRSPHLKRASRSPKTKSATASHAVVGEPPVSPKGEVPRICTDDLARMLHGEPSPKGSPVGKGSQVTVPAVTSLSEQLKKKEQVKPLPMMNSSPSPRKSSANE